MSEFVENPSVLTKDKLKSALLANNVALPNGDQRKDVYVQLYLKNLTALNKKNPSPDAFSSDEELPTPVVSNKSRSGRKATKKTDKPRPEDVDVAELTDQELTEKLQQYGVPSGPIVASTRKVYEKKLQKLLDQGPPETATLSDEPLKADGNQNGNTDSDQYSDKEEETPVPEPEPEPVPEPEPEPAPVVERPLRSRGKTPVTTRTRSSQHNKDDDEDEDEDEPVFNVKRWRRRSTRWREQNDSSECYTPKLAPSRSPGMPPDNQPMLADDVCEGISTITELKPLEHSKPFSARSHPAETSPQEVTPAEQTGVLPQVTEDNAGFSVSLTKTLNHHHHNLDSLLNTAVLEVPQVAASSASSALSALETLSTKSPKHAPLVEKVSAKESTYVEEKDVLKELFPNEVGTPTGISATCRRPIRGAAGRPVSDVWLDESRLRLTELRESSYIESRSVSRVGSAVPLSSSVRPAAAAPPSGQTQPRRKLPVWVKLLLLGAVAGFGFFVYQAMETNELNPFYMISSSSGSSSSAGESTSK